MKIDQEIIETAGKVKTLTLDEVIPFFSNRILMTQAAGLWLGRPLLIPVDIEYFVNIYKAMNVPRISVMKMEDKKDHYFLVSMNFL